MPLNRAAVRELLKAREFSKLFIEHLGWDSHRGEIPIELDGRRYLLKGSSLFCVGRVVDGGVFGG